MLSDVTSREGNLLILESYQNFVVKDIGDKGLEKGNTQSM